MSKGDREETGEPVGEYTAVEVPDSVWIKAKFVRDNRNLDSIPEAIRFMCRSSEAYDV